MVYRRQAIFIKTMARMRVVGCIDILNVLMSTYSSQKVSKKVMRAKFSFIAILLKTDVV